MISDQDWWASRASSEYYIIDMFLEQLASGM